MKPKNGHFKNTLPIEQCLDYSPSTGLLVWKHRSARCVHVGDVAGSPTQNGYIKILFQSKTLLAHRVAWFIYYGKWPVKMIDHINGNKKDNRIENLREVTLSENMRNTYRHRAGKLVGASWRPDNKQWQSHVKLNRKNVYLGLFKTAEEAHKKAIGYLEQQSI